MASSRSRDVTAVVRRRLVAGLIDLALTFVLFRLVSSIIASTGQFVLMLLYMVGHYVLLPGLHGVSLGKLIMKLRLVNGDGVAPGIIPAIVRTVAFLGDAPLLIGVMLMTGSPGHRRLGDTAAGTYVISAEMVGTPLPVDRFRLAADAPKPTKIEDPAVVARRLAQDKKKQKKKRKDADPYIIPWTPGNTPESAQRAKEADLDALAAAAGNANRQGTKKKAAEIAAPQPSDLPLAHTTWQPSENHEEAEPATGRGARRAAARAEKQALKAAKAETKAAAKAASAVGDITTAGTDESPAMAARPFAPVSHDEAAPPAMDPRWKVGSADANSDRVGDTAPDNEPVAEGDETDPASQAVPSTKRHRLRVPRRNKIKGNTPVPPPPPAEPWSPSAPLAGAAAPSWIPSPASPSKETDTPVVGGETPPGRRGLPAFTRLKAVRSKIRLPRRKPHPDSDNQGNDGPRGLSGELTAGSPIGELGPVRQPALAARAAGPVSASAGGIALADPDDAESAPAPDHALWGAIDPDRAREPQWDAERGSYVQFDLASWRWMIYQHEEEAWRTLD